MLSIVNVALVATTNPTLPCLLHSRFHLLPSCHFSPLILTSSTLPLPSHEHSICRVCNSPSPPLPSSPTSSPSNGVCASSSLENANLTTRSANLHPCPPVLAQPTQILKPILHSLLIPGTLSFLSVASNRKLKTPAFRLIGAYAKKVSLSPFLSFQFIHSLEKAKTLQFLDLSQNSLDKRSIEYIVAGLPTAPEPGLVSLRLDDCQLRPAALETLCNLSFPFLAMSFKTLHRSSRTNLFTQKHFSAAQPDIRNRRCSPCIDDKRLS